MAKKIDTKAAVLAAAQGSGAVFEALEHEVDQAASRGFEDVTKAATGDAPAAPDTSGKPDTSSKPDTYSKDAHDMNAPSFAPTFDVNAAAANVRTMFDGKTMMERSQRLAQEAAELAKANVEAMVASSRLAAQNVGTLGQDVAELGRKGFEGASEAMKSFAEAKSPVELLRLQSEYAKSYMETMISEGARLSETMVKLASEAMEPVSSRFAAAAEKAKTITKN